MQVVTFIQAQQNLEAICEQVWQAQESYLISHNSHAVVLLSQQQYEILSQSFVQQLYENNCSETLDLKTFLLAMPNVGEDDDFNRMIDARRNVELST
jgi:PHD/YefM family antitoxin component YafN of YafNO toxin-antitoxin module